MESPRADDRSQNDPQEDPDEPIGAIPVLPEPSLEVGESEPERQRKADAVGMDLDRPNVECDGDGFRGTPRARLRQ